MEKADQEDKAYIGYLDSVRGIAAVWVVLFHFINYRFHEDKLAKLVSFLFNGETAIFLFVLSGFVLSYKYIVLGHPLDIRRFFVQRFLRFWPAFFIAVLINALYQYRHDLSFDNLFAQFVSNKGHFWEEALMIRYRPGFSVNPYYYLPGWALVVILSMSFLVPFYIALAQRNVKLLWWLLLAFLLVGNNTGAKYVYHIHFVLGVLVACYFPAVVAGRLRVQAWYKYRYLLLAAAVLLFSMRQLGRINHPQILGPQYHYWVRDYLGIDFSLYSGVASFIFLVALFHYKPVQQWLNARPLRYVGKVSYCLYLMHWIVVVTLFDHWEQVLSIFPTQAVAIAVAIPVGLLVSVLLATLLYYFVELPSVRFSKYVAGRFSPSLTIIADKQTRA